MYMLLMCVCACYVMFVCVLGMCVCVCYCVCVILLCVVLLCVALFVCDIYMNIYNVYPGYVYNCTSLMKTCKYIPYIHRNVYIVLSIYACYLNAYPYT